MHTHKILRRKLLWDKKISTNNVCLYILKECQALFLDRGQNKIVPNYRQTYAMKMIHWSLKIMSYDVKLQLCTHTKKSVVWIMDKNNLQHSIYPLISKLFFVPSQIYHSHNCHHFISNFALYYYNRVLHNSSMELAFPWLVPSHSDPDLNFAFFYTQSKTLNSGYLPFSTITLFFIYTFHISMVIPFCPFYLFSTFQLAMVTVSAQTELNH